MDIALDLRGKSLICFLGLYIIAQLHKSLLL